MMIIMITRWLHVWMAEWMSASQPNGWIASCLDVDWMAG